MATNAEKLVEAEAAYHDLMLGVKARVVVDQNGERVEYSSTNSANLLRYISDLKNLIACEAGCRVRTGPAGVIF